MKAMSLPLQQKANNNKRTGKRISFFNDQGATMKEASQNASEGPYYGLAGLAGDPGHGNPPPGAASSAAEGQRIFLNSVIFSPEKGEQSHGHYQQMMPKKWALQNPSQQPQQRTAGGGWSQGVTMTTWTQNFASNLTSQNTFPKQMPSEDIAPQQQQQQQQPDDKPPQQQQQQQHQHQLQVPSSSIDSYRDSAKGHAIDWEQQQQQQQQSQQQQQPPQQQPFQPSHKPAGLNTQQLSGSNPAGTSVLQPFQVAFGQPKQHLPAGYYQVFQQQAGSRTLPNLSYSMQTNSQNQIQSLQKHDQQHVQRQQQQQQQQQLILQQQQMQHQYQQQQLINQQSVPQQSHQHQPQPQPQAQAQPQTQHIVHQSQQTQKPTQHIQHSEQMQELQPHLEHTSHIQQHQQQQQSSMQHIHLHQTLQQTTQQQSQKTQQSQPTLPPQKSEPQIQQRTHHILEFHVSGGQSHSLPPSHPDQQPTQLISHSRLLSDKLAQDIQYPCDPQPSPPISMQPVDSDDEDDEALQRPHRPRPLPREDEVAQGKDNPFLMPVLEQSQGPQATQESQKGASEGAARVLVGGEEVKAAPMGVIQSTRRKRRVSQEANLETLAQKASEMESLPSQVVKEPHRPWSPASGHCPRERETEGVAAKRHRDESLLPLVIPVSVPVRPVEQGSSPEQDPAAIGQSWIGQTLSHMEHKPSVIVTRRRSLRSSLSDNSGQNGGAEDEKDGDGKTAKSKRRPRPEPLFIPPPKLGTFIVPAVYSSITPYQSHLRSPVRLADSAQAMPPYTPPPILSPVREGSGLYFSTFLSNAAAAASAAAAAGSHVLPPVVTPKSATRSLLRSNSCDITPPVLSAMSEATPVSLEPRINIGVRYQAEIPELCERPASQYDQHKADMVWSPLPQLDTQPSLLERVKDLLQLACSSALTGGGTNQELAMHCLHTCRGDVMGALTLLLLETPIFPKPHPLSDYHYSGSDNWTLAEKRLFNKGISAYKKDFFMVQKLVSSKSVSQCVEFYYTYKKQVKIGRNGTLIYGDVEPPETKPTEEEVDIKSSQRFEPFKQEEDCRKWERSAHRKRESSPGRLTQSSVTTEHSDKMAQKTQDSGQRDQAAYPPQRPDPGSVLKTGASASASKGPAGQEGEFPCKKCGRIFYKVKSRSAHMKSHAEQEKKAAAQRQREAEERAAAAAAAAALSAARQNGARDERGAGSKSSSDNSSDDEDENDEDWH
ncbi:hypothetical protein ACEWY4_005395 [Coilia grayii]|uniref:ELM2 and SANT domain-containing protein 1 n=1 Tax=Coilia grayii TaxID=363190 RepID=A0ABD1KIH9_9TELE